MTSQYKVLQALKSINQPLGVISTVNPLNKPESSTVYYMSNDALDIYFITRSESRKYKNIQKNPNVSFVISNEYPPQTIQLEGSASEVTDPDEQLKYYDLLSARAKEKSSMPPFEQIVTGELVFMKITVLWARFGNFEIMKEGDKFVETALTFSNNLMDYSPDNFYWNFY